MTTTQDARIEPWLEHQLQCSAKAMLQSISPVSLIKHRPGFGQTMRPMPGAIIASPVLAAYDPDPDYFFHWFRDSAVVIDALRLLYVDGRIGDEALQHLRDFTAFSLALNQLDGRTDAAKPHRRDGVAPDFLQFIRDDAELAQAHGDAVIAEARVNPDGTLDVSKWSRPQHDGPPLRALAVMRWAAATESVDEALATSLAELIAFDLDFTLRHWREASHDIWEEESGHHYYTLRVSAAALAQGAAWFKAAGDAERAQRLSDEAQAVHSRLDAYGVEDTAGNDGTGGYFRSRPQVAGQESPKALDIAVILSAIHAAGGEGGAHSAADPRMQATLARLEALFDAAYPINRGRVASRGPAMGRYAGDVYYSGGAYYFSTLGAAEFCFRAAAHGVDARHWFDRGDAYLATVRAYTPADGALSEQFDQASGVQTSAKQLAWSHAAFISCVAARRAALLQPMS